VAIIIC